MFDNWRKVAEMRRQNALLAKQSDVWPEAAKFPCKLCQGEALLARYIEFSTLKNPSQRIADENDNKVFIVDFITCVECGGNGCDNVALFEAATAAEDNNGMEAA